MNVKSMLLVVTAVLVLTAFAPAAQAQVAPLAGVTYECDHYNPDGSYNELLSGFSVFEWTYQNTPTIKRGIETYLLYDGTYDNRKVDFFHKSSGPWASIWEFTVKYGPQCKSARVSLSGNLISFTSCDGGFSKICSRFR